MPETRKPRRFQLISLLFGAASLLASAAPAFAQSGGTDAAAEALFRDGRQLMEQGNFAEACQRFEASYQIDAAVGTILNLADCLERDGRLASAWAKFLEAASHAARTNNPAREAIARQRAAALEPRLVRGRFTVHEPVPGLQIRVSGAVMPQATWAVAIPIDPGHWIVEASAPGYLTWRHEEPATTEGRTIEVVVPPLAVDEVARAAAAEEEAEREQREAAARAAASAPPPPPPASPVRTAGWVVGGVGVATLGASFAFTLNARTLWEHADCPANLCNTYADQNEAETAHQRANVATGLVIGGGALVAGSIVLIAVGGHGHASTGSAHVIILPTASATRVGLEARGTF